MRDKEHVNIRWGMILSYLGLVVSVLGTLLTTNRVLEYIGDYNYGLYSFVGSVTSWLTIVTAALNASFVRFSAIEANEKNGDTSNTNTVYLKLFLIFDAVILCSSAAVLLCLYLQKIRIGQYSWEDSRCLYELFALSVLNIVITIPTTIYSLYITFKKEFIFARILAIGVSVMNYVGHLVLAYFTRSVISIAVFTVAITVVSAVFNYVFCHDHLDFRLGKVLLRDNRQKIKAIILFSGIIVFNTIVDQINSNVDKTILGFMKMPEAVTVYQLGYSFVAYLISMSVAISGVYVPTVNELVVQNKDDAVNALYLKVSKLQLLVMSLVAFAFVACGKDFVLWWVGPNRIDAYYVGAILMVLNICPLSINASIEIQRARNKHLFRAIVYFVFALLNVILSILFMGLFEGKNKIYGCVIGTVIATVGSHWVSMNLFNKIKMKLPVGRYFSEMGKVSAAGILGVAATYIVKSRALMTVDSYLLRFFIEGGIFVFVYGMIVALWNRKAVAAYLRRRSKNAD